MNFARSSLKLFVARVASAGIQFLGITYFARVLGAAPLGVFFLFEALLGMLAIPADFGLRGAVEKRISEGEDQGTFLSSAIGLKLVPITVIVLTILLLRPIINAYLGAEIAIYLAAAIVLQEAAQLSMVVLKGELRVGETAILQAARQVTWVGVGAVLVTRGFGAIGLVYGLLAGLGVMLVWGWYKVSVFPSRPSRDHAHSLFDYGKFNVVSSVGGYFYSWMDVAIIGLFLTQAHVGAYEIAWRVTAVVILLSQSIATALFPQVSRWDAEEITTEIESTIRESITPSIVLVIPSFFGTLVLSREMLNFVFGPEFTIAWLVLIVLMGEKVLQSVHVILGRALQGIDRPDLAAYATVISLVTNLILNIVFVLKFGMIGAAIATAISFGLNTVLHGYFLSEFISIKMPTKEILWCSLSASAMTLLLLIIDLFSGIVSIYQLLGMISLGAVFYILLILIFKPFRERASTAIKSVLR